MQCGSSSSFLFWNLNWPRHASRNQARHEDMPFFGEALASNKLFPGRATLVPRRYNNAAKGLPSFRGVRGGVGLGS